MAKRSPILGYNHNVKYRGVIFHVQTEDSGLLSPHLFTHLFHGGVIVSTRKLVYDPGANEEAIKALMQAQHKAVMKDLKRGVFDEKIDQYLGHVEGREPSANATIPSGKAAAAAPADLGPPPPSDAIDPPTEVASAGVVPVETLPAGDESVPIELSVPKPRTTTAQRSSPANKKPPTLPPPPPPSEEDPQTYYDAGAAVAAAVHAAATQPIPRRPGTPPPIPPQAKSSPAMQILELEIGDDDGASDLGSGRARIPRDTALEIPQEVTVAPRTTKQSDGIPRPLTNESSQGVAREASAGVRRSPTGERASLGAAALPPMKAPSRPSIAPPQRPVTASDLRARKPPEPELEEVELEGGSPGDGRDDRPGTYSMGRARPPAEQVQLREKTGRMAPIPSGLTPPSQRSGSARTAAPSSGPVPQHATTTQTLPIASKSDSGGHGHSGRSPNVTAPIANRPQSGVVMTRPAVIVGAPPKPIAPTQASGRVRKAREDEGRGFGQGLISEKSLDEVILAYLSEDAEDKG